jgi:DNA-binding PadR family transcriptional regulator
VLKSHLELLLLGVLKRGSLHGYAVIAGLRDHSDGEFDLPEGSVYPALHKLEAAGLVESEWTVIDGRKRRVYSLTAAGGTALAKGRREWKLFARGVEAVIT